MRKQLHLVSVLHLLVHVVLSISPSLFFHLFLVYLVMSNNTMINGAQYGGQRQQVCDQHFEVRLMFC